MEKPITIYENPYDVSKKEKYTFRFHPNRVCVPVGMACNVQCLYCMRNNGKTREIKELSDMFKEFLKQLDPAKTEAIVMNGGEPLLYIDRIKEIFSLVPKSIHKCVMTNGTLLTQDFVDYLNSVGGELHFSHEGIAAEYLKGRDILKEPKMVDLLNQVKRMRVYTLICSYNPDVMENFNYIYSHLDKVEKLYYTVFPMFCYPGSEDLIKDFDFDTFTRSFAELKIKYPHLTNTSPFHAKYKRNNGLVVLPDGSVGCLSSMKRYGTVENSVEELRQRIKEASDMDYCLSQDCYIRDECSMSYQFANPFTCKAQARMVEVLSYLRDQNAY